MINRIKKKINRYRQSSAISLFKDLQKKGVLTGDIDSSNLAQFYSTLRRFKDAPDFESAKRICNLLVKPATQVTEKLNGIIVETRKHPALEPVIENVLQQLQIPIQLFHGRGNLNYIIRSGIKKHIDSGMVVLTPLAVDALYGSIYNALFLSLDFWKCTIGSNKIIVFQTDAILCKNSDYTLSNFIDYDYIGSAWNRKRPVGMIANGGNGGLSIRDWDKTCEVLKRFPSDNWPAGEDGYFAFHMELIGAKVADISSSRKFGTQIDFMEKSFGGHKITDLEPQQLERFLRYCPEARVIL